MSKDLKIHLSQQLRALEGTILNTEEYFYRKICRWYSETFHTSLPEVGKLPMEHVLLSYYEDQAEKLSHNELYEFLVQNHLPEIYDTVEAEAEEFARSLEEEQAETIQKKAELDEKEKKVSKSDTSEDIKPVKSDIGRINMKHPAHKDVKMEWDDEE